MITAFIFKVRCVAHTTVCCAAGFAVSLLLTRMFTTDKYVFPSVVIHLITTSTNAHAPHPAMLTHIQTSTLFTCTLFFFFLSLPLRCLRWVTRQKKSDWHPPVSTSVTLGGALWSRHRTAERGPWKYLRSAARGGGTKERNLLLINKIMGAIRPFSHHQSLQSLSSSPLYLVPLSLSLRFIHFILYLLLLKKTKNKQQTNLHSLFQSGGERESERKKARLRGGGGWDEGAGWSSNQQLTGVRMFMGRVSLSDWSSVSSAVALNTHSL